MENISKIKRSELFNEINTIVIKHNDDLGYLEVSCELEELFENKMDVVFKDIHVFYEWAKQKCSTDGNGSWKLVSGGVIYFYSTKELYKYWKSRKMP